jgi:iron complex outermembrane receptor protein
MTASAAGGGYWEPDTREEFESICDRMPGGACDIAPDNPKVQKLVKNLAERRPLDIRPYRGDYDRHGRTTRDTYGAFASGEFPLPGDTVLFALTSFDQYQRSQESDTDFTPERLFETIQDDEAWQIYGELRVGGELEAEPVEWKLGGYYLQETLDVDGSLLPAVGIQPQESVREYSQDIHSFGIWGDFGWDFADDFTLEGGVRWNYEKKDFDFHLTQLVSDPPVITLDERTKKSETWQTPTGQLVLTYHIGEDTAAYARYARGFKAGHFNAVASRNFEEPPADEEYNDSWEAGLRGSWFDQRLLLAAAYFYYRYENYQIFLFTDSADPGELPVLEILNAKEAENYGVEVEGTLSPLRGWAPALFDGLRLSGTFGWLHGEYIDFVTTRIFQFIGPSQANGVVPVAVDYSGNPLQNAPEYKVSTTVEWRFDLGRWGYLIPRYDMNWSDDVFFDPNEGHGSIDPTGSGALPDYAIGQKAYFLHNVRLAYRTPSRNVEIAGWCRNVEDQTYKNFVFDASRFTGIVINFPGEPRSYGIDVTFTF